MLAQMDVVPGQGIDFDAVRNVLLLVLAVYVASSVLSWLQGYLLNDVIQNTVRRMRNDVEDKINRLPLRYFDKQPRGELLSRVTNDIDNISQTLQQTMSQLLVRGAHRRRCAVDDVLDLAAAGAGRARHGAASRWSSPALIMKRSQGMFIAQWRRTGKLNAHIEEAFTGHALVKVFGRQHEVEQVFAEENDALFDARFGAQFVSGLIMPTMMFIGNLNYVAIAVVGGLRVANGLDEPRRRAGVHPVLPPVHAAAHPGRVDGEPAAVRGRVRRAGLRAARRRGGARASEAAAPAAGRSRRGRASRTCRSATSPTSR